VALVRVSGGADDRLSSTLMVNLHHITLSPAGPGRRHQRGASVRYPLGTVTIGTRRLPGPYIQTACFFRKRGSSPFHQGG
jgi:hypothetical protein